MGFQTALTGSIHGTEIQHRSGFHLWTQMELLFPSTLPQPYMLENMNVWDDIKADLVSALEIVLDACSRSMVRCFIHYCCPTLMDNVTFCIFQNGNVWYKFH